MLVCRGEARDEFPRARESGSAVLSVRREGSEQESVCMYRCINTHTSIGFIRYRAEGCLTRSTLYIDIYMYIGIYVYVYVYVYIYIYMG